jgi:hypothetical protein
MISAILNYLTIGILVAEQLESHKNMVTWVTSKVRFEYQKEYGKEVPYDRKYSYALAFCIYCLLWPLVIFKFFGEAKNPNQDFSSESE